MKNIQKSNSSIIINYKKYQSYYDNTLSHMIVHHLKMIVLGIITLGFAYPWILCSQQKMICAHSVICGKRLKFIGNPKELIDHWVLWWLLTILTLGLYSFVTKLRFQQWIIANTIFEDEIL